MDRLDNQMTTILLALILGMTILACLCYGTIFVQPNVVFNPLSPDRATAFAMNNPPIPPTPPPTHTPDQSYPATWTTTPTNTPRPTGTPTDTRTSTPTRTSTSTSTPTPTNTKTAAPPPPPPMPTSTPTPYLYFVASHSNKNNCADIGLEGTINGTDGLPKASVQIQYGESGVAGSRFVTSSDNNGRYAALLLPGITAAALDSHNWYVYVLENGRQASKEFTFTTDPIRARNPRYCADVEDENEAQKKGCLADPCKSNRSTQIKIINWQLKSTGN